MKMIDPPVIMPGGRTKGKMMNLKNITAGNAEVQRDGRTIATVERRRVWLGTDYADLPHEKVRDQFPPSAPTQRWGARWFVVLPHELGRPVDLTHPQGHATRGEAAAWAIENVR